MLRKKRIFHPNPNSNAIVHTKHVQRGAVELNNIFTINKTLPETEILIINCLCSIQIPRTTSSTANNEIRRNNKKKKKQQEFCNKQPNTEILLTIHVTTVQHWL